MIKSGDIDIIYHISMGQTNADDSGNGYACLYIVVIKAIEITEGYDSELVHTKVNIG